MPDPTEKLYGRQYSLTKVENGIKFGTTKWSEEWQRNIQIEYVFQNNQKEDFIEFFKEVIQDFFI